MKSLFLFLSVLLYYCLNSDYSEYVQLIFSLDCLFYAWHFSKVQQMETKFSLAKMAFSATADLV